MEDIRMAKKEIEEGEDFRLFFSSKENEEESIPASLALFYSLRNLGKNAKISAELIPEKFNFLVDDELRNSINLNYVIKINESGENFSGLFYKKTDKGLYLYLAAKKEIEKKQVEIFPFNNKKFFAIGIPHPDNKLEFVLRKNNIQKIINIDNREDNEEYGHINIIMNRSLLSEISFDLIRQFGDSLFNKKTSTAILAGIFSQKNRDLDKIRIFKKIAFLTKKEVDFEKAIRLIYPKEKKGNLFALEKAIKNTSLPVRSLAIISFPEEKFVKTVDLPGIIFVLKTIKNGFFPFGNILVLWQTGGRRGQGVIFSNKKEVRQTIIKNFNGKDKDEAILFSFFGKLSDQKNKILTKLSFLG